MWFWMKFLFLIQVEENYFVAFWLFVVINANDYISMLKIHLLKLENEFCNSHCFLLTDKVNPKSHNKENDTPTNIDRRHPVIAVVKPAQCNHSKCDKTKPTKGDEQVSKQGHVFSFLSFALIILYHKKENLSCKIF